MKRLTNMAALLLVVTLLPVAVTAGDDKDKVKAEGKEKGDKAANLETVTLTGTLVSETKEKTKDGVSKQYTLYFVSTENGKVHVPQPKPAKKGESPAFDLADFDGANVKITAQAHVKQGKNGAKAIYVVNVTDIARVSASET